MLCGIDYGIKRIGLATADLDTGIAFPAETLAAVGDVVGDARLVLKWAAGQDVEGFVVGLPLNMDGTDSDQTRLTRRFVAALEAAADVSVETWDERLSSYQADEWLDAAGVRGKRRKAARDALAAQAILQGCVDRRRAQGTE